MKVGGWGGEAFEVWGLMEYSRPEQTEIPPEQFQWFLLQLSPILGSLGQRHNMEHRFGVFH